MDSFKKKFTQRMAGLIKNHKTTKKQLIMSCVSLVIASAILATTVFCWLTLSQATATSNMKLNADNGLRLNYDGNSDSNIVQITEDATLYPASSVDGQNLYFPSDGTFTDAKDTATDTKNLTYRCANAGDIGNTFLQYDFDLTAFSDDTSVFIDDEETYVRYTANNAAIPAIRVAFIFNNGKDSVVMNPTGATRSSAAVSLVNYGTGTCRETKAQTAKPFSDYSSDGQALFTLDNGETQHVSVVVWLEGTDSACVDSISGEEFDINILFTSTWEDMEVINFVDQSTDSWVTSELKNTGSKLTLSYTDSESKKQEVSLATSTSGWSCKLPKTVTEGITFTLTASDGSTYTWTTDDRGESTTWYATGTNDSPDDCTGYWKADDSDNDVEKETFDEDW